MTRVGEVIPFSTATWKNKPRFQYSTSKLTETWHTTSSKTSHVFRKYNSLTVLLSRGPLEGLTFCGSQMPHAAQRTGRGRSPHGPPPPPPPTPRRRHSAELYPHFLQHDPLGVGGAAEGVGLQRRAQVGLLVLLVVPLLVAAVAAQLAGGAEPSALPCGTRTVRDEGGDEGPLTLQPPSLPRLGP